MSDKPRVYVGVRVKTTVKELLQRHRAREANSKKNKTISHTCLDLQVLCASTFPSRCVDAPPAAPAPDAHSMQLRAPAAYPAAPTDSCSQMQAAAAFSDAQQPFVEAMLPVEGYGGGGGGGGGCGGGGGGGGHADGGYNTPLPPPPAFPLPWCHGLSPETDYSGMAPCSPAESLKLYSPVDHNSYSPQDSFSSSSSSSCYDSPTRAEYGFGGFPSDCYHYQHCNFPDCFCLPTCWLGPQESLPTPEYAPYYPPTDCSYACPAEESYFRSNLAMSSEMCYNVL